MISPIFDLYEMINADLKITMVVFTISVALILVFNRPQNTKRGTGGKIAENATKGYSASHKGRNQYNELTKMNKGLDEGKG